MRSLRPCSAWTNAISSLRPASSSRFSYDRLQRFAMQAQFRHQQLQTTVLALHLLQPLRLVQLHAAVLLLPLVERRRAVPVLATHIRGLHPASCCFNIPIVCSSLNRLFFINPLPRSIYENFRCNCLSFPWAGHYDGDNLAPGFQRPPPSAPASAGSGRSRNLHGVARLQTGEEPSRHS